MPVWILPRRPPGAERIGTVRLLRDAAHRDLTRLRNGEEISRDRSSRQLRAVKTELLSTSAELGGQSSVEHLGGFRPLWVEGRAGKSCFRSFLLVVGK